MKTIGSILFVIAILALLWIAYKFFFKKNIDGTPCSSTGSGANDGIIVDGVCTKTANPVVEFNISEYFVNGDPEHDKQVFSKGLDCARAFVYKNPANVMSSNLSTVLALQGRGDIVGTCQNYGFNCEVAQKIKSLDSNKISQILNYMTNLNIDRDWRRFSNIAAGNKNMCSVILQEAYRSLSGSISGRG